jgi:hypothetical protein
LESGDFFEQPEVVEVEPAEIGEPAETEAELLPAEPSDAELAAYINSNIKLSKEVTADNMAEEFSDGYLLGEWLTKEGLQSEDRMASFVANPSEIEGLSNLMRVIPAARGVDVEFSAADARSIMRGQEGAARGLITNLIQALTTRKQKGAPKPSKKKLPKGWCTVKDRLDKSMTYYENTYTGTRYLCAHYHPPADPAHQMTRHNLEKRLYDPETEAAVLRRAERVAQHRAEIYARNHLIREYKKQQMGAHCCAQAKQRAQRVKSDAVVATAAAVQAAVVSAKYAEEVAADKAGNEAKVHAAAEDAKQQQINAKRELMASAGFDAADEALFDGLPTQASVALLNFEALCFPNGSKSKGKKGAKRKELSKQSKVKQKTSKTKGKQADSDEKRVCLEFQSKVGCERGEACPLAHVRMPAEMVTLRFQLWLHEGARGGWRGAEEHEAGRSGAREQGSDDEEGISGQKPESVEDSGGEAKSSSQAEQQIQETSQAKTKQIQETAQLVLSGKTDASADDASKQQEEQDKKEQFNEHLCRTNALVQQNAKQQDEKQQDEKQQEEKQQGELEMEEERLTALLAREKEKEKELELEQQQLDDEQQQIELQQKRKPLPPEVRELEDRKKHQEYSRPQRLLVQQQQRRHDRKAQQKAGDVVSKSLDGPLLSSTKSLTAGEGGGEGCEEGCATTIRPKLLNYQARRHKGGGVQLMRSLDSSSISKMGMNDIRVPPSGKKEQATKKKKSKKKGGKIQVSKSLKSGARLPRVQSYSRV